jgi:hypothetical protein
VSYHFDIRGDPGVFERIVYGIHPHHIPNPDPLSISQVSMLDACPYSG